MRVLLITLMLWVLSAQSAEYPNLIEKCMKETKQSKQQCRAATEDARMKQAKNIFNTAQPTDKTKIKQ